MLSLKRPAATSIRAVRSISRIFSRAATSTPDATADSTRAMVGELGAAGLTSIIGFCAISDISAGFLADFFFGAAFFSFSPARGRSS